MIHKLKTFFNEMRSTMLLLANDAEVAIANSGEAAVFELQQDGSLFVPYGEYAHAKGLQKFTQASAQDMKSAANSLVGKTVGIPIFAGHPDVPGRPDSNPAAPAYGWITDIQPEADGARFLTKWNKRGEEAIANAEFRFYSPNWWLKKVSGGLQPVRLKSMGLTNHPCIPVPPIANDSSQTNPNNTKEPMNEETLKLLGLAADATPEAIDTRIKALLQAETDLTETKGRLTQAECDLTTRTTELSAANDRATSAETRATATRNQLIDATLDRAVAGLRITEGDRAARRTELVAIANDAELNTKLHEIEAIKPVLKTSATTRGLGKSREILAAENDAAQRSQRRQTVVADELKLIANDVPAHARYDLAYGRAQAKHPELFTKQATGA